MVLIKGGNVMFDNLMLFVAAISLISWLFMEIINFKKGLYDPDLLRFVHFEEFNLWYVANIILVAVSAIGINQEKFKYIYGMCFLFMLAAITAIFNYILNKTKPVGKRVIIETGIFVVVVFFINILGVYKIVNL